MIIKNLDVSDDWTFGKGASNYLQGIEAIKINIKTRLKEWVNDCFFSLNSGVDWKNRLDYGQIEQLHSDIRNVILKSYGIVELIDLTIDYDRENRKFNSQYQVTTIYSQDFTDTFEV